MDDCVPECAESLSLDDGWWDDEVGPVRTTELRPHHRDKKWRDREGDTWRYDENVGWRWSRPGQVLDEPGVPLRIDGPFEEVLND